MISLLSLLLQLVQLLVLLLVLLLQFLQTLCQAGFQGLYRLQCLAVLIQGAAGKRQERSGQCKDFKKSPEQNGSVGLM